MKFEKTLQRAIYKPWKDHYLDYGKLKALLREDADDNRTRWTETDEAQFVEELLNVQLEKVNAFQREKYRQLDERMGECERQLEQFASSQSGEITESSQHEDADSKQSLLRVLLDTLNLITKEINELEKFSRLNFTGALKAAKKHDRRRGTNYRVRPILQVRLASLPFNSEDYSPLLYRLSAMYTFTRQQLNSNEKRASSPAEMRPDENAYTSYKFFVHPDNLLEVKTYILRHLPVLVYSPSTIKNADGVREDPTITSLYFDSPRFDLYDHKVGKDSGASSLRIRWFGQLADRPDLVIEKKTMQNGNDSYEKRFAIKDKYVMPFIKGSYRMEKSIQKLQTRQGPDSPDAQDLEAKAREIQTFIEKNSLQPLLRANYTRSAFQIPGDDRVRIAIDTNLALIREDALDVERPCRDPEKWHRSEIDDLRMHYPFESIKKGEIFRFPYAVLEIKQRSDARTTRLEWIDELMSSHLVKEASRFSKFVHGVASLFEDQVNIFPFWMSLMETDIRKNPDDAFREEQEKKAKQAEDEFAVGSFLGTPQKQSFKAAASSPIARSAMISQNKDRGNSSKTRDFGSPERDRTGQQTVYEDEQKDSEDSSNEQSTLRSYIPTISTSKYARARRLQVPLPAGVRKPSFWIKDTGPVKVEPKVWLANQRTFVKWEHMSVLLGTLGLSLYNAAGVNNRVARMLALVYTCIAAFTGAWGWMMYIRRSRMIKSRSGRDFDSIVGPLVVCISLAVALCLNLGFQYNLYMTKKRQERIEDLSSYLG